MTTDDRFRYAYNSLVYFGEDLSESIARVARYGYDAIEIVGEPTKIDPEKVLRMTKRAGIGVSSICSIYTADRDLVHPDPDARRSAVQYVKDLIGWPTSHQGDDDLGEEGVSPEARWGLSSGEPAFEVTDPFGGDDVKLPLRTLAGLDGGYVDPTIAEEPPEGGIDLAELQRLRSAEAFVVEMLQVVTVARMVLQETKQCVGQGHASDYTPRVYTRQPERCWRRGTVVQGELP